MDSHSLVARPLCQLTADNQSLRIKLHHTTEELRQREERLSTTLRSLADANTSIISLKVHTPLATCRRTPSSAEPDALCRAQGEIQGFKEGEHSISQREVELQSKLKQLTDTEASLQDREHELSEE